MPNHDAPFEGFIALVDGKIKREPPAEAAKGHEFTGDVSWAGLATPTFSSRCSPRTVPGIKYSVRQAGAALVSALGGPSASERYTIFIGPKQIDILESVGKGIERAIDFGYFGLHLKPLLYVLHFFHRFTGSYGLDIIILHGADQTVCMAPLTHKELRVDEANAKATAPDGAAQRALRRRQGKAQ